MKLMHLGLVSSSEEKADRFFADLLGLSKTRRSRLPAALGAALFGVDRECEIVYYGAGDVLFEVFLTGQAEEVTQRISHVCLEVANRGQLLGRCQELGFRVRQAPKGDHVVCFVEDADGNLFEIKEEQSAASCDKKA